MGGLWSRWFCIVGREGPCRPRCLTGRGIVGAGRTIALRNRLCGDNERSLRPAGRWWPPVMLAVVALKNISHDFVVVVSSLLWRGEVVVGRAWIAQLLCHF